MTRNDVPTAQADHSEATPDLGHPRGTLAIVIVFGVLFALGWFAMYLTRYVPGGVPHH